MQTQSIITLLGLMNGALSQLDGIHFVPKLEKLTKSSLGSTDLNRCPMPWSETCHRNGATQQCYPGEVCPPCWTLINEQWNCYDYTPSIGCPYNWIDIRHPQLNKCTQSQPSNCLIK
ncbi:hypothetical protein DSO57_1004081 [Entomophthora muscae]|uniref:Uncharacterized protein n=1 Tax=Entomophthora muscae TaxID=34485 RepID=A0ACC2SX65_9FUNG|nr:hypothetical protein DSO57_1004081 [Entomophthora muscae]